MLQGIAGYSAPYPDYFAGGQGVTFDRLISVKINDKRPRAPLAITPQGPGTVVATTPAPAAAMLPRLPQMRVGSDCMIRLL